MGVVWAERRTGQPDRRGYTLIEVLLVVAVVAAFAAIVWPPLLRMYKDYRLREAAERVRAALAKAHLLALDQGVTYQFRFEPEGRHYVVLPYEQESDQAAEETEDTTDSTSGSTSFSWQLPEDMTFGEDVEVDAVYTSLTDDQLSALGDARALEGVSWSAPLLFYPDGTATDGQFEVLSGTERYVEMTLRGLTSSVTVSRVKRGQPE